MSREPGPITGCTNAAHNHLADVMENWRRMNACTFAEPSDTINLSFSRRDAQRLVDSIRRLQVPGMYLESLMLRLTKEIDIPA